jgi:hypothetical protein
MIDAQELGGCALARGLRIDEPLREALSSYRSCSGCRGSLQQRPPPLLPLAPVPAAAGRCAQR